MTIKQLGGVFGRNPTFNDVTIEGQLTFDGDIDINSDLNISGDLGVNIGTDSPTTYVEVRTNGATGDDDFINLTRQTYGNVLSLSRSSGDAVIQADKNLILRCDSGNNQTGGNTNIIFQYDGSVESARFDASGNLAFTSGNGIDFSATAGTGTSELFDDYEEGTWTPEYTTSNGDYASVSYVFQLGSYRKIGSLVFITLSLRTSAVDKTGATGFLHIKNLPFTPAAQNQGSASMSVSYSTIFNSIRPMGAYIKNNETLMYLTYIATPIGSNWSELGAGELSTANPANIVVLSGCYIAA